MTPRRIVPALVLAALVVGTVVYAAPSWWEAGRQLAAERRWPGERAEIESALLAVDLPARYDPVSCDADPVAGSGDRCWRVTALPEEVVDELGTALRGVAEDVLTTVAPPGRHGSVGADAVGLVAGRTVQLTAWRETDAAALPATPFGSTTLVRLTADLSAP
ncbi:hypothetical protein [Cellulomonas sp. NPDC058312]|uniref:hypothetical protein n=1 Tax=Cellulomonas sp. NPDC058312 TaxID=3346441 RepID=UPI0036E51EE9